MVARIMCMIAMYDTKKQDARTESRARTHAWVVFRCAASGMSQWHEHLSEQNEQSETNE